jgi:hypothetical protein
MRGTDILRPRTMQPAKRTLSESVGAQRQAVTTQSCGDGDDECR